MLLFQPTPEPMPQPSVEVGEILPRHRGIPIVVPPSHDEGVEGIEKVLERLSGR